MRQGLTNGEPRAMIILDGAATIVNGTLTSGVVAGRAGFISDYSGTVSASFVVSGAKLAIGRHGEAISTVIAEGGFMTISTGGTAQDVEVGSGGTLKISAFGTAFVKKQVTSEPCVVYRLVGTAYVPFMLACFACCAQVKELWNYKEAADEPTKDEKKYEKLTAGEPSVRKTN